MGKLIILFPFAVSIHAQSTHDVPSQEPRRSPSGQPTRNAAQRPLSWERVPRPPYAHSGPPM